MNTGLFPLRPLIPVSEGITQPSPHHTTRSWALLTMQTSEEESLDLSVSQPGNAFPASPSRNRKWTACQDHSTPNTTAVLRTQDPGAGRGKGATLVLVRILQVPSLGQGSDSATQSWELVMLMWFSWGY